MSGEYLLNSKEVELEDLTHISATNSCYVGIVGNWDNFIFSYKFNFQNKEKITWKCLNNWWLSFASVINWYHVQKKNREISSLTNVNQERIGSYFDTFCFGPN